MVYAFGEFVLDTRRCELRIGERPLHLEPQVHRSGREVHRCHRTPLFLPEGTPEQLAWFGELQRVSTSPETAVRLIMASAQIDVCDIAPQVRTPTLVLHATADAVIPFEQGRLLAGMIPGARFAPLESRNHILLESEPAWPRFLEEVRAFLAEDTDPVPIHQSLQPALAGMKAT